MLSVKHFKHVSFESFSHVKLCCHYGWRTKFLDLHPRFMSILSHAPVRQNTLIRWPNAIPKTTLSIALHGQTLKHLTLLTKNTVNFNARFNALYKVLGQELKWSKCCVVRIVLQSSFCLPFLFLGPSSATIQNRAQTTMDRQQGHPFCLQAWKTSNPFPTMFLSDQSSPLKFSPLFC